MDEEEEEDVEEGEEEGTVENEADDLAGGAFILAAGCANEARPKWPMPNIAKAEDAYGTD